MTRLTQLSSFLSELIEFGPKTRHKAIKPYLAGTEYGDTKIGAATAHAVNRKREAPFTESSHTNPGISTRPKITKIPLIQPDNRGREWITDSSGSPIRKAKGADLVHPTEAYAKVKTQGLIIKHQRELHDVVGKASGEEGRIAAAKKFVKHQKELSGEGAKFKDREGVRESHRIEIANVRSHVAQAGAEGHAIVKARNQIAGSKLPTHEIPDFLRKTRADLDTMVESHVETNKVAHKAIMAGLEGELSKAVIKRHSDAGIALPDEAHVAKVVRNHIGPLNSPSIHSIDLTKHYGNLSDMLGKSHEEIQGIHKKLTDHAAEGSAGARALKRQEYIQSGKIFDEGSVSSAYEHIKGVAKKGKVRTDLKSFPILRKAGIAAGIIGAAGAGIAIGRNMKKKKKAASVPEVSTSKPRVYSFSKKIPKINQLAEDLLRKSNLRRAVDRPANPLKKLSDIPRELKQRPAWAAVEDHAIKNTDVIASQVAKRKKEALGQIVESHTTEGLKAIQKSALQSQGNVADLIRAKRAITGAKLGLGQGKAVRTESGFIHRQIVTPKIEGGGSIAKRALGGFIGRDPSLLQPRQKRLFNVDIAAIGRDTKTYNAHRKWMAEKGEPIGTISQRRKMLAGKIKTWKVQAKASDLMIGHTAGLREELAKTKDVAAEQAGKLDEIRKVGQDFPHRIERARAEAYQTADSEAIRNLKGAKKHWEGVVASEGLKKDIEHGKETMKLKRDINKKIAIGVGAGATAGAVGGYKAGKERKKNRHIGMDARIDTIELDVDPIRKVRRKIEGKPEASIAAHAITGGLEGAAGIYATDPLLEYLRKGRAGVRNPLRDTFRGHVNKISTGAIIGAAATAPIGYLVERQRARRRAERPLLFAVQSGNRTAVTRDRYGKKIYADDKTKAENNYVRTAIGGAAVSALLRKSTGLHLKPALLAGAVTGIGVQAIVRNRTAKTKDQFGDRSFTGKRIDNIPGQAAGLATIGITGKRFIDSLRKVKKAGRVVGLHAHGAILSFDDHEDSLGIIKRQRRSKEAVAIDRYATYATRGGRLARDIKATIQGKKVLDARGREKRKEWDRPWVRAAATGLIIAGTGAGVVGIKRVAGSTAVNSEVNKLVAHLQSGTARKAAKNLAKVKVPGVAKAAEAFKRTKAQGADELASAAESSSLLGKLNKGIERYAGMEVKPKFVETRAEGGGVTRHYEGSAGYARKIKSKMSDAEKAKQAAERSAVTHIEGATQSKPALTIRDWIKKRKPSTNLASMIHTISLATAPPPGQYEDDWEDWLRSRPGVAKRTRRRKTLGEKEENKKVINRAKIGAGLLIGTAIGASFPRANSAIVKNARRAAGIITHSSRDRMLHLNSRLDGLLSLQS